MITRINNNLLNNFISKRNGLFQLRLEFFNILRYKVILVPNLWFQTVIQSIYVEIVTIEVISRQTQKTLSSVIRVSLMQYIQHNKYTHNSHRMVIQTTHTSPKVISQFQHQSLPIIKRPFYLICQLTLHSKTIM